MKDFKNKVAVITGAASGIGKGLAIRCANEGMKVVLADINKKKLDKVEKELNKKNTEVISVHTDVSKEEDVQHLAEKSYETFGEVNLLFNNAGVVGGPISSGNLTDIKWTIEVNLFGVIYGVHSFLPRMKKQKGKSHIVNTASTAGLICGPYSTGPYNISKYGVVALSESLYFELLPLEDKINVSVLCPGFVNTNLLDSDKNRPERFKTKRKIITKKIHNEIKELLLNGLSVDKLVDHTFNAIEDNKLFILTHHDYDEFYKIRVDDIINERNPKLD